MADEQTPPTPDVPPQPQVVIMDNQTQIAMQQQALAQAAKQSELNKLDETVEGGKYLVNGVWLDAEGRPYKAKGK